MSLRYIIIPVTPFQQNCTVLICTNSQKAAIVDPGGDIDLILKAIDEEQVIPEKILVTHGHLDHVGAVSELAIKLSIPIEGPHVDDKFWIDSLNEQSRMFGFPECEVFTPQRWLKDNDQVTVGVQQLSAIHCPGHTPGHIVFYHQQSELALVGDVLFNGSIGRTDFPKGDYDQLITSIKTKLWLLGKQVQFIPGHGPMSSFENEMKNNPFVRVS